MHLPFAVHRHPGPGDHPDRPEPGRLTLSGERAGGGSPAAAPAALAARNVTRDTDLATSLEVADSLWGKFMGLMGRPVLATGSGLWLPESNGIHMMFMRFPIDAVFVGRPEPAGSGTTSATRSGEVRPVLSVHRGLRAWTGLVPLVRGAHGVLELPVGTIDASGTQVGDRVRIG